jgi:transcription antitermination factor NusG
VSRKLIVLREKDNPPAVWPEDKLLRDFTGIWWVAHTKSRNEKALANELRRKNVQYFLPMTWKLHHYRGRKMRSFIPLFTSYLFFCGKDKERVETLKTNRVANVIEVVDQQHFVDELEQIQQALAAGSPLSPHAYLKEGQKCRVTGGPLADLQGVVVRTSKTARLVLQIDMLGQAASVEIDTDLLELVEEEPGD